ncbi:hypothetical protein [Nocardioides sp. GXZ039]|uniref:hypothetical protein n=1 Tax=Nocardioides sp. GXZ039 TaxID=3136018 RepID=UPI0030F42D7F
MAKKRKGSDRRRQPQTRRKPTTEPATGPEDLAVFDALRTALRADGPLDLLANASAFLEVTDPQRRDPFAPEAAGTSLNELVDSFIGTPYAETTAVLTALRVLTTDELLAKRIAVALRTRRHPMPDWLTGIEDARLEPEVWSLTEALGDGEDYLLGVALPSGHALAALIYVDHNLGTAVKDAFVVPDSLGVMAERMRELLDPTQTLSLTDPAAARAAIEDAITTSAMLYPPPTSDSWPMCRPLIEWMVRMLPAGAGVAKRQEWTEEETQAIADDFFDSRFGGPVDHDDGRDLLDSLLWFGTDYGSGDPYRWSPVVVEIVLTDWFPRKVQADRAYLAKMPDVLRAFVRYCHDRAGLAGDLTTQTLAAIDHHEVHYLEQIGSRHRRTGMPVAIEALLGQAGFADPGTRLDRLADHVGGRDALEALDDTPLPDEDFDWGGIRDDIRPVVAEILVHADEAATSLFDVEHRTALRRLLARVAREDPTVLARKASTVRSAAALTWAIAAGNRSIGETTPMTTKSLLAHFGVGPVADRAGTLLQAVGIPRRHQRDLSLGDPALLVSRRRASLIESRNGLVDPG